MKLHGTKVPHCKNTADMAPEALPVPKAVTIPMSMHIGKPSKPVVKRGDEVKVGTLIAEPDGYVSAPIFSSVSGKVAKIDSMKMSSGQSVETIVIETDGLQELDPSLKPPKIYSFDSLVEAMKQSGLVGLGGAGFPSFVKFAVKDLSKVEVVVINAAECEPYITSDTRTMLDKTEYIFKGIDLVKKYLGVKRFVIGVEDNKPQCVEKLREFGKNRDDVEVCVVPAIYPQGGEKVLVYNTTGKIIPQGGLPLNVGVIVINVTSIAYFGEYAETGVPLVNKVITVDGSAIKEPKNLIAPIGTPIKDLLEYCGTKCEPAKILYGGPMMGIAVPSDDCPVLKMTNAIIAMDEKDAAEKKPTPCINCGRCLSHCPLKLDPRAISRAYNAGSGEELEDLYADLCMECGCCSYVCPAKRPLVQTNKLAKALLREYKSKKEEKK